MADLSTVIMPCKLTPMFRARSSLLQEVQLQSHISSNEKALIVILGAKGIGRMISEGYVTNGAKVYISSRDATACEKAAAELTAIGESWLMMSSSTLPPHVFQFSSSLESGFISYTG